MAEQQSLAGKVAWVTGSSRGLGRVVATRLCALGAAVAVHGTSFDSPRSFGKGETMERVARNVAAAAGGTTMPIWGNVMDEAEIKRMADGIRTRLGRIDILVTNAGGDIGAGGTGVGRGGRPSPDDAVGVPLADIKAVLDRNLLSCICCCREVAPEMMRARAAASSPSARSRAASAATTVSFIRSPRRASTSTRDCLAVQTAAVQCSRQLHRSRGHGYQSFPGHS